MLFVASYHAAPGDGSRKECLREVSTFCNLLHRARIAANNVHLEAHCTGQRRSWTLYSLWSCSSSRHPSTSRPAGGPNPLTGLYCLAINERAACKSRQTQDDVLRGDRSMIHLTNCSPFCPSGKIPIIVEIEVIRPQRKRLSDDRTSDTKTAPQKLASEPHFSILTNRNALITISPRPRAILLTSTSYTSAIARIVQFALARR